jgi:hypothetical protein
LILDFIPQNDVEKARELGFKTPFYEVNYDFKLKNK